MLKRLAKLKYSNLFGQFVSYEENEVLCMLPEVMYSQHFIFFVTHEWAK
jgi:hypothetical protein